MPGAYCHLCGKSKSEVEIFQLNHPAWPEEWRLQVCAECLHSKPRCMMCGIPMKDESNGQVCATCLKEAPRCDACGQPLTGRYFEVEDQRRLCPECYHGVPACDVCGGALNGESWQLSDGRLVCPTCHDRSVYQSAEAVELFGKIQALLEKMLGMRLNVPTGIVLVDRDELVRIYSSESGEFYPPDALMGLYLRHGLRRAIYIQNALPQPVFAQVTGHEFGHAWQAENNPVLVNPLLREGFAEWVAFHLVNALDLRSQKQWMLSRMDVYGQGLRQMLDIERRYGPDGVLRRIQQVR